MGKLRLHPSTKLRVLKVALDLEISCRGKYTQRLLQTVVQGARLDPELAAELGSINHLWYKKQKTEGP